MQFTKEDQHTFIVIIFGGFFMFEFIIGGIIILVILKIIFSITKVAVKILLFIIMAGIVLYLINSFFPLVLLF